jgi:hypothetical protein
MARMNIIIDLPASLVASFSPQLRDALEAGSGGRAGRLPVPAADLRTALDGVAAAVMAEVGATRVEMGGACPSQVVLIGGQCANQYLAEQLRAECARTMGCGPNDFMEPTYAYPVLVEGERAIFAIGSMAIGSSRHHASHCMRVRGRLPQPDSSMSPWGQLLQCIHSVTFLPFCCRFMPSPCNTHFPGMCPGYIQFMPCRA